MEIELADLYPTDPDGAAPIAYLWARTVRCEAPKCGAEIPIYKTSWLSKKGAQGAQYFRESPTGRSVVLLVDSKPMGGPISFRIARGEGSEDPRDGFIALPGTKAKGNNASVICPCCGTVLPGNKKSPRTPTQLSAQHGGADVHFDPHGRRMGGARILAVVTLRSGQSGRQFRLPTERDYEAVHRAQARIAGVKSEWERSGEQCICPVPDEPLPPIGTLGFRVQRYGMLHWGDLFMARQKAAFVTLIESIVASHVPDTLKVLLAMVCTKLADRCNSLVNWSVGVECPNQLFKGNAVPMAWDFAESNILSDLSASFAQSLDNIARNAEVTYIPGVSPSPTQLADACASPLADQAASVWFTYPPDYNAVPYSDLSDFFFVWFKRALLNHPLLRDPFDPTIDLHQRRVRRYRTKLSGITDGRRTAGGSRRRWQRPLPRGEGYCAKMVLAP